MCFPRLLLPFLFVLTVVRGETSPRLFRSTQHFSASNWLSNPFTREDTFQRFLQPSIPRSDPRTDGGGDLESELDGLTPSAAARATLAATMVKYENAARSTPSMTPFSAWKIIGKGLVKLIKFAEIVLKGTCISISVESGQTCGGLMPDTCSRLDALRKSVASLKTSAEAAISNNDELLRWNATNVHAGLEMRQIAGEIDGVVTVNAALMDLLGSMDYDDAASPIHPGDITEESGDDLGRYKFRVLLKPHEYLRKMARYLKYDSSLDMVKNKIAFGVALGLSMSAQCLPDVLRGMHGLDTKLPSKTKELIVLLTSTATEVTFGYQYATKRQFFANVTRDAAEGMLLEAQRGGLAGFFDLFAGDDVKRRVVEMGLKEASSVRVCSESPDDFLQRLKSTGTLERLVDVTKSMTDVDFDAFINGVANKDPFEVLKDLEIAKIPANPHGIGVKVMKKLAKAFKNFDKFFTDVKKSLKLTSNRFEQSGATWNKIGYYGFGAMAQLTSFANMALCVTNIVATVEGARQMRAKIVEAEKETDIAVRELEDARRKGAQLLELQKSLNRGILEDLHNLTHFLTTPLNNNPAVDKEFRQRVIKIQNYFRLHDQEVRHRGVTVDHVTDVRIYLHSIYGLMQSFYNGIYKERRAVQKAKALVDVEEIKKDLMELGHAVPDHFSILRRLAFSEEFFTATSYDSFPLSCIREKGIRSEEDLKGWFGRKSMPMAPQVTKAMIKTMVDFWDEDASGIEATLSQSGRTCFDRARFVADGKLGRVPCTRRDIWGIIATDVLRDKENYKGVQLGQYRKTYDC